MNESNGKKWFPVASTVISFVIGVVVASYILGQRTGKVLDLQEWKNETAPRIERMDSKGTLSFEIFHDDYLRTQARQEKKLDELEKQLYEKQVAELRSRIEQLERKP